MSPHKKIYLEYFGYKGGDWVACEVCHATAVDIHAIDCDGMGGRPSKSTHVPENLIALCRSCHRNLGDKKQFKDYLREVHQRTMNAAKTSNR